MTLTTRISDDGSTVTIAVNGRFDFNLYQPFRDAYEKHGGRAVRYVLDLSHTEYIDSSALGMLLVLRERSGGERANIRIRHCNPAIKEILKVSNFDRLFHID